MGNRLTIEDAEKLADDLDRSGQVKTGIGNAFRQLADIMRDNERLRDALKFYAEDKLSATKVSVVTKEAKSRNDFTEINVIDTGEKAREALSYKDSGDAK